MAVQPKKDSKDESKLETSKAVAITEVEKEDEEGNPDSIS